MPNELNTEPLRKTALKTSEEIGQVESGRKTGQVKGAQKPSKEKFPSKLCEQLQQNECKEPVCIAFENMPRTQNWEMSSNLEQ
jgi:hypothetical protein